MYMYNGVRYKLSNERYAYYYNNGWRVSASVTNEEIKRNGVKLENLS